MQLLLVNPKEEEENPQKLNSKPTTHQQQSMWTAPEEEALREAICIHGTNYKRIKQEYGPGGNNKLTQRITGNRIMSKARTIAQKNPEDTVFRCVLKTNTNSPPKPKPTFPPWTGEQDETLLASYRVFGSKWKSISNQNAVLQPQYNGSRFRDRLALLQARQLKQGQHVDALVPGKEKTLAQYLTQYLTQYHEQYHVKDNHHFIECPGCERRITAQDISHSGLVCVCGASPVGLLGALNKYPQGVILAILGQASGSSDAKEEAVETRKVFHEEEAVEVRKVFHEEEDSKEVFQEEVEAVETRKVFHEVEAVETRKVFQEEEEDSKEVQEVEAVETRKVFQEEEEDSKEVFQEEVEAVETRKVFQEEEDSKEVFQEEVEAVETRKVFQEDFQTPKMEPINPNLLSIRCPHCWSDITETQLMTTGLVCKCRIDTRELSRALDDLGSVVYIISNRNHSLTDPVEYIGVTNNMYKRLYSHKEWMSRGDYTTRISLRLSERACIQTFKPTRNCTKGASKQESYTFRIKDTVQTWDGVMEDSVHTDVTLPKRADLTDSTHITSAGLTYGHLLVVDTLHCYKKNEITCKCTHPCTLRGMVNTMRGFPIHYPIPASESKSTTGRDIPDIDYTLGLPCEPTTRFLTEAVKRNGNVTESTKTNYSNCIKVLCDRGLIKDSRQPESLIISMQKGYSLNTFMANITALSILFMCLTNEEKRTVFGDSWLHTRNTILQASKAGRVEVNKVHDNHAKTASEEKNWVDLPDLIKAHKEFYTETPSPGHKEFKGYLMTSLYLHHASIRNDYRSVKLFDYNTEKDNYLDWDNKTFVFNEYKNKKYLGKVTQSISPQVLHLVTLARDFANENGYNYIVSKEMMTTNAYGYKLRNTFERITGKRIGSQLLRKITVSHLRKDELTNEENSQLSNSMMHRESTSRKVYRKV